ncbi:TlpA family protein disulfide reductase [Patescibacteria group bacterium]
MGKIITVIIIILALGVGAYFIFGRGTKEKVDNIATPIAKENEITDEGQVEEKGASSNYIDFNAQKLSDALGEGKTIMLYFTANWCPTCRVQEPINVEAFKELEGDSDIVIFMVHILDSETTDETEKLAKEYDVRLQHSYVLINSQGEVVFTHTGPLTKSDLLENISKAK